VIALQQVKKSSIRIFKLDEGAAMRIISTSKACGGCLPHIDMHHLVAGRASGPWDCFFGGSVHHKLTIAYQT
jgi:hypothetical protein